MRNASGPAPDLSSVLGSHLLIALSGGGDSVALAHILSEGRERYHLKLSAAHMDHAIRTESAEDAEFCRALCAELSIPFYTTCVDVPAIAAQTGEGLETVARRLRYRWLHDVRAEVSADHIALAHHMDDQAETVLMHLSRGAGPEGISAMREHAGVLYRPLLNYRKSELTAYLAERGVTWREDPTNAEDSTPRNAIRLHVIPELEKSYPRFVDAAARYAHSARIESDYVAEQTRGFMARRRFSGPYGDCIDLSEAVSPAILRRAIRAVCGSALPWEKLNAIEALCAKPRGRIQVSEALHAERCARGIYFVRENARTPRQTKLSLEGCSRLEGVCAIDAHPSPPVPVRDDPFKQVLNRDALEDAVLRTRLNGDRFRPLGGPDKKLSDYFTDRKVDRPLRDSIALVAIGSRVLWVCGMDISEDARIRGDADRAVRLECRYDYGFMHIQRIATEED